MDYGSKSILWTWEILLPRKEKTFRSLAEWIVLCFYWIAFFLHFFPSIVKNEMLKKCYREYCRKACLQMHSLLASRKKSSDIYLSNVEKEKKNVDSIACARREAFMICLSYYSDCSPLFCLFSMLLIALVSTVANRFSTAKPEKNHSPKV